MATLRVIELFAGIGAQAAALDRIGADWESVGIVEIDPYCVTAYNAIHGTNYTPQDITKIESLPACDMLTYSFPCTDISTAGKQRGLAKGSGTHSSLLYEVERLIEDYERRALLPKYLVMENVKNLVGKKFRADFENWVEYLNDKGYRTYWKVLNAADYGVPQHRERVIAISILCNNGGGQELYEFPDPIPLKKCLKDVLEDEVDEKYYIKDAALVSRLTSTYNHRKSSVMRGGGNLQNLNSQGVQGADVCRTIRCGGRGSTDRHSWNLIWEETKT